MSNLLTSGNNISLFQDMNSFFLWFTILLIIFTIFIEFFVYFKTKYGKNLIQKYSFVRNLRLLNFLIIFTFLVYNYWNYLYNNSNGVSIGGYKIYGLEFLILFVPQFFISYKTFEFVDSINDKSEYEEGYVSKWKVWNPSYTVGKYLLVLFLLFFAFLNILAAFEQNKREEYFKNWRTTSSSIILPNPPKPTTLTPS